MQSKQYWKLRQIKEMNTITDKSIEEIEKKLKKYYKKSMKQTIADFESTYNHLLATVANGEKPTPADLYKLDKYYQMQADLKEELQKLGDKEAETLSKAFEDEYRLIYESISIPSDKAFKTFSEADAKRAVNTLWCEDGKFWSERIWTDLEKLAQTLDDELISCVVAGKKTTELKHLLMEKFNTSYYCADRIARTEIAHIQTEAALQRYKDYGLSQYEFFADKDERTCPICGQYDGKVFYLYSDGAPKVPLHPNCRCCVLPVID